VDANDITWEPIRVGTVDGFVLQGDAHDTRAQLSPAVLQQMPLDALPGLAEEIGMIDVLSLTPQSLKALSIDALPYLATQIRAFLLENISKTGGHIGSALGVIELTLALHYVFDSPADPILFDTGHQGYCHRIVTNRATQFSTLNTFGGMSRFLDRADSPHDVLSASHAGTAISTAVGLAQAMRAQGDTHRVVVIVGDGTLGEGSCWEGLNFLAGTDLPVLVVINDNGMSIPPTVGGIATLLTPRGATEQVSTGDFFRALGLRYHGPFYGHDCGQLIAVLQAVTQPAGPCVVHIKTEKGHGLPCAALHPYKMHFSMPFDAATGAGASPTVTGRTYATVVADALASAMEQDPAIVVVTPATPYASGLEPLMQRYPDRVLDVGMAEQHAVSMAAGLALGGQKPVVCMQSTFLQRAYDQVLHDVCYPNLPVTFLVARSGFAGYDSPTHHGLWDIPVLTSFPRLIVHSAMDTEDATWTLHKRLQHPEGPMVLLHPYEPVPIPEPALRQRYSGWACVAHGTTDTLFCLGNTLATAHAVRALLAEQYQQDYGIVCVGRLAPLPADAIRVTLKPLCPSYVTIEEGAGGFGALVRRSLDGPYVSWLHCDTRGLFVPAGSKEECAVYAELASTQIVRRIIARWGSPVPREALLQAGEKS
jgi:1-deoxy-D-xylulose-5-phosphate synthase